MTTPTFFRVRGRLPTVALAAANRDAHVALRSFDRDAILLFVPHHPECEECVRVLHDLAAQQTEYGLWDGKLVVVARDAAAARSVALRLPELVVAVDATGAVVSDVAASGAGALLADRYGEVYHAWLVGRGEHEFPDATEVRDWFRFLTMQCPECGVPDIPTPSSA